MSGMAANGRMAWIDWARIIGMYCIIFGHFFPAHGSRFVYTFSVPLFFFLSGYLTKPGSATASIAWQKVWKGLAIPMIIFVLVNWINLLAGNDFEIRRNTIIDPWLLTLAGYQSPLLGTLWFIYDLIILRFVMLVSPAKRVRILGLVSLFMMYLLNDLWQIHDCVMWVNIWGGMFFMWIGTECRHLRLVERCKALPIPSRYSLLIRICSILTISLYIYIYGNG